MLCGERQGCSIFCYITNSNRVGRARGVAEFVTLQTLLEWGGVQQSLSHYKLWGGVQQSLSHYKLR